MTKSETSPIPRILRSLFLPPPPRPEPMEYAGVSRLLGDPVLICGILAAILLFIPCYLMEARNAVVNADEWQALVTAAQMADGATLYNDVWDNHGPALMEILAVYFRIAEPADYWFVVGLRWAMLVLQMATVIVCWGLFQQVFQGNRLLSLLTLYLLLGTPIFLFKGSEIRGDNPMNFLFMGSLLLWFVAERTGRRSVFLLSGILVGLCFWFSVKTLILGVAMGLLFIANSIRTRRLMLPELVLFGLGSLVGPATLWLYTVAMGNGQAFMDSFLGQNFDRERPPFGRGFDDLRDGSANWAHWMAIALVYTLVQVCRRKAPPLVAVMWPCATFLAFQYMFLIPTHHHQSFLIAIAPCAILMVWMLVDMVDLLPLASWGVPSSAGIKSGIIMALVVYHTSYAVAFFDVPKSSHLNIIIKDNNELIETVGPDTMVFDGLGHPLFNPKPTMYPSLVETIRYRIKEGLLDVDIPAILDEKDVPYIIWQQRTREIDRQRISPFLLDNYLPYAGEALMAAGKILRRDSPGSVEARIHVAGDYWWDSPGGNASLRVDGQPAANPIRLEDGLHTFDWDGPAPLFLCIRPRADWESFDTISQALQTMHQELEE